MAFKTQCPKCGVDGELFVSAGKFYTTKMKLCHDGFSFSDAKNVDTEDEWVECHACGMGMELVKLITEDD
jgi:hypothetical protein